MGVAGAAVNALRAAKGMHDAMPKEMLEEEEEGEGNGGGDGAAAAAKPAADTETPATAAASGEGQGGENEKKNEKEKKPSKEEQQAQREQEAQRVMQEGLPSIIQLMWRVSALDVQVSPYGCFFFLPRVWVFVMVVTVATVCGKAFAPIGSRGHALTHHTNTPTPPHPPKQSKQHRKPSPARAARR